VDATYRHLAKDLDGRRSIGSPRWDDAYARSETTLSAELRNTKVAEKRDPHLALRESVELTNARARTSSRHFRRAGYTR
jgi:hypothetical protein